MAIVLRSSPSRPAACPPYSGETVDMGKLTRSLARHPTIMCDDCLAETRQVLDDSEGYIHNLMAAKVSIRDALYTNNRIFLLTGVYCKGPRKDHFGGGYRIDRE